MDTESSLQSTSTQVPVDSSGPLSSLSQSEQPTISRRSLLTQLTQVFSPFKARVQEQHEVAPANDQSKKYLIGRRGFMQIFGATALSSLMKRAQLGPDLTPFPTKDDARLEMSPVQANQIIKETLGLNPNDYGMEGMIQIPSRNDKYFLHIGQIHSSGDIKIIDPSYADSDASQRDIERLLTDAGIKNVYSEASSVESMELLDVIFSIQNNVIAQIPLNNQGLKDLSDLNSKVISIVGVSNTLPSNAWLYLLSVKLDEMRKAYKENPEAFKPADHPDASATSGMVRESSARIKSAEEFIKEIEGTLAVFEEESIHSRLDAATKMYLDGKLKLHPAEVYQENREGRQALAKLTSLIDRLLEEMSPEDKERLVQEIEAAKSAVYKEVYADRDKIAIEMVTGNPVFKGEQVSTIVYGAGHDFFQEVTDYNKASPQEESRGLMYLAPKRIVETPRR